MRWWKLRQMRAQAGLLTLTHADPAVAAVKDQAARILLEEYRGRFAQQDQELAYLGNQVRQLMGLLPWIALKPGNPFDQDNRTARTLVEARPEDQADGTGVEG